LDENPTTEQPEWQLQAPEIGPEAGMPSPCLYNNWPTGMTYITGHVTGLWNPTGYLWDPGTRGGQQNFGFYV